MSTLYPFCSASMNGYSLFLFIILITKATDNHHKSNLCFILRGKNLSLVAFYRFQWALSYSVRVFILLFIDLQNPTATGGQFHRVTKCSHLLNDSVHSNEQIGELELSKKLQG